MDRDDSLIGVLAELDDPRGPTGELRLVAAVLETAIEEARRGDPDALAWLASDVEGVSDGWSFRAVCDHLAAEPSWLRVVIASYIAAHPYVWRPRHRAREINQVAA